MRTVHWPQPRAPHVGPLVLATALAGTLYGCGGGGSSGGSNPQAPSTYTVGGGITGLSTQGLVLANGTDSVSPNPGDLSFVMPTAVVTGTSYNVVVQLQPDGLNCTVSNGSGSVGTANVTDVSVACVAATYGIGGAITGLTASGLTLSNGSDTVSPAAGATTFVFPTKVPANTAFNVLVASEPTGLTCLVSNGTGVVLTSSVTNVAVSCH